MLFSMNVIELVLKELLKKGGETGKFSRFLFFNNVYIGKESSFNSGIVCV